MNRLLRALAQEEHSVKFTCPASGIELVAVPPTTAQKVAAASAYAPDRLAIQAAAEFNLSLVSTCVLLDGEPLGAAADELPSTLVTLYATYVQDVSDRCDPSPTTWTDEEVESFEQAVKKNTDPLETLMSFDLHTLRSCIIYLVGERSHSETSIFSSGSTEEQA